MILFLGFVSCRAFGRIQLRISSRCWQCDSVEHEPERHLHSCDEIKILPGFVEGGQVEAIIHQIWAPRYKFDPYIVPPFQQSRLCPLCS